MASVLEDHLMFDGVGINGPDQYRTRLATFTSPEAAKVYGPMLAAAPDLLAALRLVQTALANYRDGEAVLLPSHPNLCMEEIKYCIVDAAINVAEGRDAGDDGD